MAVSVTGTETSNSELTVKETSNSDSDRDK